MTIGTPVFEIWEQGNTWYVGGTNPVQVTKPTGTVSGDFLLAFGYHGYSGDITLPPGFQEIDERQGSGVSYSVGWKIATGSEPSLYDFTTDVTDPNNDGRAVIIRVPGVHQVNPFDIIYDPNTHKINNTPGTTTHAVAPIGPITSNTLLLAWFNGWNVGPVTTADLAGWTVLDNTSVWGNFNYLNQVAPGTVDPGNFTTSNSPASTSFIIALRDEDSVFFETENVTWDPPSGWEYTEYSEGVITEFSILHEYRLTYTGADGLQTFESAQSFSADEILNRRIYNFTDDSTGVMGSHASGTGPFTLSTPLAGGIDNEFNTGDSVDITVNMDVGDQIGWEVQQIANAGEYQFQYYLIDKSDGNLSGPYTATVQDTGSPALPAGQTGNVALSSVGVPQFTAIPGAPITALNVTGKSQTAYKVGNSGAPLKKYYVRSNAINPKSILRPFSPQKGDIVTYNPNDCYRLGDPSTTTTFSLDLEGVPTVVGVNGNIGHKHGTYICTINYKGTDLDIAVHHTDDEAVRSNFNFPAQDANGDTIRTPKAGSLLIYLDPDNGNDSLAGPTGNGSDNYVMGTTEPTGGWEDPSSVNAYATRAAAFAEIRDNSSDCVLFARGTTTNIGASTLFGKSGIDSDNRIQLMAYGTGTMPFINIDLDGYFLYVFASDGNLSFFDLIVGCSFKDPTSGDYNFRGNLHNGAALPVYAGGELPANILVEGCHLRHTDKGFGSSGAQTVSNYIIRRSVIHDNYNENEHAQGGSTTGDLVYIGECVLDHNGWSIQRVNDSRTATGGDGVTVIETGAFVGIDYIGMIVTDDTNGGTGTIDSMTDNQLNLININGTVDFSGGGPYTVGGEGSTRGQGTIFNHNYYDFGNEVTQEAGGGKIIENNIITRASSISLKLVSNSTAIEGVATGGSTSQCIDSVGGYGVNTYQGWAIKDGDIGDPNTDFGIITSHTDDTFNFTVLHGAPDFSAGGDFTLTDENLENGYKSNDLIEQWNFVADCEVGLGGGGNTAFSLAPRFNRPRVANNIEYKMGDSRPTNRNIAWGSSSTDWINGMFSGNVLVKTLTQGIDNCFGYQINSVTENIDIYYNKVVDIGSPTGSSSSVNVGCLIVNDYSSVSYPLRNVRIAYNDFQQQNNDGIALGNMRTQTLPNLDISYNRWWSEGANIGNFDDSAVTYAQMIAETGEVGAQNIKVRYKDPGASIENYQKIRGDTATEEAFYTALRTLEKNNWDTTLSAEEINAYFQEAYADRPDIIFEAVQFQLSRDDVGTEQDVTFSRVGVPKGVFCIRSPTRTDLGTTGWEPPEGGTYKNGDIGFGFADSSGNMWYAGGQFDSETTLPQKTMSYQTTEGCFQRVQGAGQLIKMTMGLADTNFFTNNNVKLKVVHQPNYDPGQGIGQPEGWDGVMIAIGGSDVKSVTVGTHNLGTSIGNQKVTTNNKPDIFFTSTAFRNTVLGKGANTQHSFGYAAKVRGEVKHSCYTRDAPHNAQPAAATHGLYDDAFIARVSAGSTEDYSVSCIDMVADGVVVNQDAAGDDTIFGWMSIEFNNRPVMSVIDTSIPTSPGDMSMDIGFNLDDGFFMWMNVDGVTGRNAAYDETGSFGFTISDGVEVFTMQVSQAGEGETLIDSATLGEGRDGFELRQAFDAVVSENTTIAEMSAGPTYDDSNITITLSIAPPVAIDGRLIAIGVN